PSRVPQINPMDWELYEQHRATLVFIGVAFLSFLLLAFQRSSPVQHVKAIFVSCTFPAQRWLSQLTTTPPPENAAVAPPTPSEAEPLVPSSLDTHAEQSRALKVLADENQRLTQLLELKRERWPHMLAAHVVNRDPQRWFQEILLDKGQSEGVQEDDPVVALAG